MPLGICVSRLIIERSNRLKDSIFYNAKNAFDMVYFMTKNWLIICIIREAQTV